MSSCLSPRSPCCGPKAALSVTSRRRERIERVREIGRHRCGVCNERNAFAREGSSQSGVTEEAVDAEEHGKAGGYRLGAGGSEHYRRCGRIGCQCHRTGYGLEAGTWRFRTVADHMNLTSNFITANRKTDRVAVHKMSEFFWPEPLAPSLRPPAREASGRSRQRGGNRACRAG